MAPEAMSLFLEGAMDAAEHEERYLRLMLRLLIRNLNLQPLKIVLGLES